MGGLQALSKPQLDSLKGNLAGQSAPPNPQTPTDRKDPSEATMLDLQRIRRATDVAVEHLTEGDPRELLIGGINACMTRLLSSIELSDAVDVLLERLFPLSSPQLKQRLQAMFAPQISPPTGLGGGAQQPGLPSAANQGLPPGATGQPPGGSPQGASMPGEAGSPPA
jgi:hypothetical protein